MNIIKKIDYGNDIILVKAPLFRFKKAGNACAAFILGYPVYQKVGFASKLFGVPFYLGDIRWQPFRKNS